MSFLSRLFRSGRGWQYKQKVGGWSPKHTWSDGTETITIFWMPGAPGHSGWVIEVMSPDRDGELNLGNGFVSTFNRAVVLADMYIRDDSQQPAAFMWSDRVDSSDFGPSDACRQDEYLDAHAPDYEFEEIHHNEADRSGLDYV